VVVSKTLVAASLAASVVVPGAVSAGIFSDPQYNVTGYVREHTAVNLEDKDAPNYSTGFLGLGSSPIGGKGEVSMARTSVKLEGRVNFSSGLQIGGVVRASREYMTDYLESLEDSANAFAAIFGGDSNVHIEDRYNEEELREFFFAFPVGDRVSMVLGKQQVVWGETDFLRGTDIIHGFDLRWRSFLETENEELRNPLWLANVTIDFPEVDGSLQLIYKPGWDEDQDVVNEADTFGGRWTLNGVHGLTFDPVLASNFNNSFYGDDTDDANYGFRWVGSAFDVGYSFSYYRHHYLDGVVHSAFDTKSALAGSPPNNLFGDIVYPLVDTFGVTLNYYVEPWDLVLRGELAYTPDTPYNKIGRDPNPLLGGTPTVVATGLAGLGDYIEKDTLITMIGFDKEMEFTRSLLGTTKPGFWTTQIFDTWITDFKTSDDIVNILGYNAAKAEHTTIASTALSMNYRNDTINPSIAALVDLYNGDFALIPALELVYGDHWRVRLEGDFIFPREDTSTAELGVVGNGFNAGLSDTVRGNDTRLLGALSNNSQLNLRVTYQF
ncbi:MAG: hypothetical protein J4A00_09410, partial [Gammaproteobacteria bacterium]|nr:hypothetical protein [Gammaproteobacteria bacterium]